MTNRKLILAVVSSALFACAHGGVGGGLHTWQADHKPPMPADVDDDTERGVLKDAQIHSERANQAATSGNTDQAKAEFKAAGDAFGHMADQFPSSEWHLVYRKMAAQEYLQAKEGELAGEQAQKILADAGANDVSKVLASRMATQAYYQVADKGHPLQIKGKKPSDVKPEVPPEDWKQFISAADDFVKRAPQDQATPSMVYQTALAEFAYDNLEDARARLHTFMTSWSADPNVPTAARLYLLTFTEKGDVQGYATALQEVAKLIDAELPKAKDAADKATDAGQKKVEQDRGEALAKLKSDMSKDMALAQARADLDKVDEQAKTDPAGAAAAYEKWADGHKDNPNEVSALFKAVLAWEKAAKAEKDKKAMEQDLGKGKADLDRLIAEHADVPEVGKLVLKQASTVSRESGDHKRAAELYELYLTKFPQGADRCAAYVNLGYEQVQSKNHLGAAKTYLDYASDRDGTCAKDDANTVARSLYNAGEFFLQGKKKKEAREAFTKLVAMKGQVTDTVTKSQLEDAQKKLKKIK